MNLWVLVLLFPVVGRAQEVAPAGSARLLAGAYARNIDPDSFPVWVSGGIVAAKGERVVDSLFARSLVIESDRKGSADQVAGTEAIAVCVVDSLGVPGWIVEQAKALVGKQIPLEPHQILISATHTHSAPALMGAHGTPAQDDYANRMPQWIAESIVTAYRNRREARVGHGVTNADRFIHCRRWFMEPGHAAGVLFSGRESNIVAMNPGHDSPYKIRQTAQVDRTIPFLSVQSTDGKPMALLASFCTHYAGAPALSSDYFGVVARELSQKLRPDDPAVFVGIMANGTSGDANCIDFARPAKPFTYHEVGAYVASRILSALPSVEYGTSAQIASRLVTIPANVRLADEEELKQAKAYVESKLADRLPSNMEENYARETVLLSQMPATRQVPLQGLRIGNLVIAGYPTETYNATGLSVRAASPFSVTMNIGLANDLLGYLPPADQFPLGGYTTWRARTSCLEESTEARVVETLGEIVRQLGGPSVEARSDAEGGAQHDQIVSHDGPESAIAPMDSLKHFELFEHQRIELAAHEPNVIDPVAIRFDDSGRLWVVEMSDYPTNRGPLGLGRIRVLRDTNLDGLYDHSIVFADGLLFPTGLQLHRDGALVTVGGRLQFLRDSDGDSVCDQSEDWLSGFAEENPQLRVNDPDFGLDGALYLANGLRSSRISSAERLNANPLSIANSDLRWDWMNKQGHPVSGPSQFGMTWDRYGNRYFCSNRNPCDGVSIEPWQAALSPLAGLAPMTEPVLPSGEQSTVRPLVNAWTTSNLHSGQFTAACGVLISHSEHLPAASLGNALTCEPTGSLVHRVGLGRVQGGTQVEEPVRSREWLASRDPWFRPVNLEEGPDGGIYVVDMHRAVIEHPDWVPEELKKRVDERWGEQCGRIYRVLRHDAPGVDPIWKQIQDRPLSKRTTGELFELLNHSRAWVQQTAGRLLFERIAKADAQERVLMRNELVSRYELALAELKENALIRMLYLMHAIDPAGLTDLLERCLVDPNSTSRRDPALRGALWRVASQTGAVADSLIQAAKEGIRSGAREEAIQSAWYLAQVGSSDPQGIRKSSLSDAGFLDSSVARTVELADDPHWLMAITAVHRSQLDLFATQWMEQAAKALDEKKMIRSFSSAAWTRVVAAVASPENSVWTSFKETWTSEGLRRLEEGAGDDLAQRRLVREPHLQLQLAIARGIAKSADRNWLGGKLELWDGWAKALADPRWSPAVHREMADLLGTVLTPDQSRKGAQALRVGLEQSKDPQTRRGLLAAWSQHPDELAIGTSCIDWIMERFDGETPAMRRAMFQAILARPERLVRWLAEVEAGRLSSKGLDAAQVQSLSQVKGELQPRIAKWLAGRVQSDRQKVVETYQSCLELEADRERGKQLFAQHCSACHRIDGVGTAVGPDISDSRTQTSAQLLVSILDPNRAIDNNYYRITVQLNDGATHDGIVVEESAEHLTLRNQQVQRLVLSKGDIEGVKSSGVSLMPEGIEVQLDKQSMADLIGYIKNWRYVGGESPDLSQKR